MSVETFGDRVRTYLRTSGYSQKKLADTLGLHPKVLSRKLHGSGNAYLTQLEVRHIITTFADWHVITTRDEALHLLELAHLEPTSFSADKWQSPPLNKLAVKPAHPIISSGAGTPTPTLTPRHNLPAPITRLIGREWAIERLRRQLGRDEVRLVTLIGPGGSGKTRLAQQVASELVDTFAQGAWFVALAAVSDPEQVPMSIIQALNVKPTSGLSPLQSLIKYLQDKQLLLLLDNFEQVDEAAVMVSEMLTATPGLKVLITSRAVLSLYGESTFSVPPLDLPDLNMGLGPAQLTRYAAIQLFVERAQAATHDFALTAENAASIAQICAMVDGLPLALELAAARMNVLSPAVLLEHLSRARLPLLVGGAKNLPNRQQTLRNTITWSYDLLSPEEQAWFARLGVFSGGWSLEAVEAMMQGLSTEQRDISLSVSSLHILEQLVDKSLLVRLPTRDGQVRFTMLETLREYTLERLLAQGELERLRDWHACYYLWAAEAAAVGLRGAQQLVWLGRLVAERDNFQAALEWSLRRARASTSISGPPIFVFGPTGETRETRTIREIREIREIAESRTLLSEAVPDVDLAAVELYLRLAAALRPYWEWQGYLVEGRSFLEAALELPIEDGARKSTLAARAKVLSETARLVCLQNEQTRAAELADASIALWQQLDDPRGFAIALLHRGWPAHILGEYAHAKGLYEQALQLVSSTDDVWCRAQLLFYIGTAAGFSGDFEQMRSLYAQSRKLFEQIGDQSALADLLKDESGLSILEGNYIQAIVGLVKSIELSYKLGYKQFVGTAMGLLGFAVGMRAEPEPTSASLQAAQLWGAADNLLDIVGLIPWTRAIPAAQVMLQQIRFRVDKQSWKEAWTTGRALSEEQAIDLARRQAYSLTER